MRTSSSSSLTSQAFFFSKQSPILFLLLPSALSTSKCRRFVPILARLRPLMCAGTAEKKDRAAAAAAKADYMQVGRLQHWREKFLAAENVLQTREGRRARLYYHCGQRKTFAAHKVYKVNLHLFF